MKDKLSLQAEKKETGTLKHYELSGLRLIAIAGLVSAAADMAENALEWINQPVPILTVVPILCLIAQMVGMARIKQYNDRLANGFKMLVASLILGVAIIAATFAGVFLSPGLLSFFMIFVSFGYLVLGVMTIYLEFCIAYGCAQIVSGQGNYSLAEQIRKLWRIWMWILIGVFCVGAFLIFFLPWLVYAINVASFFVTILLYMKYYQVYVYYNGAEMPQASAGE